MHVAIKLNNKRYVKILNFNYVFMIFIIYIYIKQIIKNNTKLILFDNLFIILLLYIYLFIKICNIEFYIYVISML